jgi:tripartite motif-containing protein 71
MCADPSFPTHGFVFAAAVTTVISGTSALSWQEVAIGATAEPPVFGEFIRQIEGVWPAAVAVGEDGRIYVLDALQRRVRAFEQDGTEFQGQIPDGERVKAPQDEASELIAALPRTGGELLPPKPVAVAVGADKRVYAVDGNNHRVVCLTETGEQVWSIGGFGTFPGQFVEPAAVALVPNTDTLLVADAQNHRVQALNTDGEFLYEWGKHALVPREGEGKIHYPNDIAVSPDGSFVVVAEMFERRLQIFGPEKRHDAPANGVVKPPPPGVQSHFGNIMAVDGRLAAVWEPELRRVLVFDMGREVPIHITTFGSYGTKFGQFTNIAGMAIDEAKRTIYILDNGTRRIDVVKLLFDPEATTKYDPTMARFVQSIPVNETLPNSAELGGLALLPSDVLAVVDPQHATIHELPFDDAPDHWQLRSKHGTLTRPIAIDVDPLTGRVAVIDDIARTVMILDAEHGLLITLTSAGSPDEPLRMPRAVCIGKDGSIYIVDAGADAVIKYNAEGAFVMKWGSTGTEPGQFWMPTAIGIDSQDRIVVLDFGNHRGQLFTTEGEWLATFSAGRARTRRLLPAPPAESPSQ